MVKAAVLAHGQCQLADGSVAGMWRVPNVRELFSLIDFGFFGPALSNAAGTAHWVDGNPFVDVLSTEFWSSTTVPGNPATAFSVDLGNGHADGHPKQDLGPVWFVREGP